MLLTLMKGDKGNIYLNRFFILSIKFTIYYLIIGIFIFHFINSWEIIKLQHEIRVDKLSIRFFNFYIF